MTEIPNWIIKIYQYTNLPFFFMLAKMMVRTKKIELHPDEISANKPYVIVANHTGMPDPFLICYSLSLKHHKKLSPYRFFIVNRFFYAPLGIYLRFMGGFPAHKHEKLPYGLDVAYEAIQANQTVVIFPEGKISKTSKQQFEPKRGVSVLAKEKDVKLIPARVKWNRERKLLQSYEIAIGKPFDGSKMSPQQILDVVYSLKFE